MFAPSSNMVKKLAFYFDIPNRLSMDPVLLAETCKVGSWAAGPLY